MGAVRAPGGRRDDRRRAAGAAAHRGARPGAALTRTARLLLLAYLLVPAAFTLGAAPTAETDLLARTMRAAVDAFTPVSSARLTTERVEFVANVLLFLPLGLLLPPALPRVPLTLLLAVPVVGSLGVEVAQLLVVPGRTPDAVDVLANSTGGAVGLLLGSDVVRLVSGLHGRDTGR